MGYDKFLQKFARKAAAKQEGLSHSLLAPSRSGPTSYCIIIIKTRKAFCCISIKANLDIRHRRLQFIRSDENSTRIAALEQQN